MENGRVLALDWGLELETGEIMEHIAYVGIRMHDLTLDGTKNRVLCRVTEVVENPFSMVVMVQPQNGEGTIGWETDKDAWRRVQAQMLEISMPPESILLLTE